MPPDANSQRVNMMSFGRLYPVTQWRLVQSAVGLCGNPSGTGGDEEQTVWFYRQETREAEGRCVIGPMMPAGSPATPKRHVISAANQTPTS